MSISRIKYKAIISTSTFTSSCKYNHIFTKIQNLTGLVLLENKTSPSHKPLQQKEFSNGTGLNWYDFGARMYDQQIGRWNGVDPLSEKAYSVTPFVYCENNPVVFVDPDGRLKLKFDQANAGNVTKADLTRLGAVVSNVGQVLAQSPQAMDVLSKTTGMSPQRILQDLTPGKGPYVDVVNGMPYSAAGNKGGIHLSPAIVKNLASIDANNKEELANQALGVALTILHEYSHVSDQETNDGANSGGYNVKREGNTTSSVPITGPDGWFSTPSIQYGKQPWKVSPTGHRGEDVEALGFGVKVNTNSYTGAMTISNITQLPDPMKTTNLPAIPALPAALQGKNVLNLLKVK